MLVFDGRPTQLVGQVAEYLQRRLVVRIHALLLVVRMFVLLVFDQLVYRHEGVIHPLPNDLPYAFNISDSSQAGHVQSPHLPQYLQIKFELWLSKRPRAEGQSGIDRHFLPQPGVQLDICDPDAVGGIGLQHAID